MERQTYVSDKSWNSTVTEICRDNKIYRSTKHALESDRDANLQAESRTQATSKRYRGVRMRSWGKWVSEIREPKKRSRLWLGSYSTPEAAARAYDTALFHLRGHSASFNFPNSLPLEDQPSLSPRSVQKAAVAAGVAAEKGFRPSNTETRRGPCRESAPSTACCGADLSSTNLLSLGPAESDDSFQTEFHYKDKGHEPSSVQERASDNDRANWHESKVNSTENFTLERNFLVDSTLARGKGITHLVERALF